MNRTKIAAAMAVILMMTVVAAPAVSAEDSVDLTATVLEPKPEIGIELSATALNFGSLYPGNTSDPQDLKVTNIGLKEIDVTATASDDGIEPLFVPGLLIDNAACGDYLATLAAEESDDTQLALHVPDAYASRGDVSGGATFWAEEHMDLSPVEDFTYTISGSEVTITGYVGPGGEAIIPSTIEGLPVTTIGDGAFYEAAFTSIDIPASVTSIGSSAFYLCSKLTSITIPDSVTSMGDEEFVYCTALASATIGSGVTSIGMSMFESCTSLTSIVIPASVTSIGNMAFRGCTSLTSITIPASVTIIGDFAFRGCTSLTSITIPASVTSIGYNTFRDCTALASATIGSGVTSIGQTAFSDCTALTSMTFEGNAPTVGSNWAQGCTSLVVYFHAGATGFTTPTWQGVPCQQL